jgi:transcription initiation factor TFIIIB Brf1 subunit/transcription initiation factor TFIIB
VCIQSCHTLNIEQRITEEAKRITEIASKHGLLKNDSVNTFAKACLFVRINEWKQIEFQREEEREGRSIEGT